MILRLKNDSVSFKINLLSKITTVKLSSIFLILLVNLIFLKFLDNNFIITKLQKMLKNNSILQKRTLNMILVIVLNLFVLSHGADNSHVADNINHFVLECGQDYKDCHLVTIGVNVYNID